MEQEESVLNIFGFLNRRTTQISDLKGQLATKTTEAETLRTARDVETLRANTAEGKITEAEAAADRRKQERETAYDRVREITAERDAAVTRATEAESRLQQVVDKVNEIEAAEAATVTTETVDEGVEAPAPSRRGRSP